MDVKLGSTDGVPDLDNLWAATWHSKALSEGTISASTSSTMKVRKYDRPSGPTGVLSLMIHGFALWFTVPRALSK